MFTATLYNNTGFNVLNVPDKPSLLNTAASSTKNVPAMDILQLYFNTTITIKAFETDVMQADYLKLTRDAEGNVPAMSAYYVIDGYNLTSYDTVELSVIMEPFLTAGGIDEVDFLDGIATRHHTDDNYINKYTEDDPLLVPTYPIEVKNMHYLFHDVADAIVDNRPHFIMVCITSMPVGWRSAQDADIGVRLNIPNTDYTETDGNGNTVYCTYNKAVDIGAHGTGGSFAVKSKFGYPVNPENCNPIDAQYITMISSNIGAQRMKTYLANLAANGLQGLIQALYYVPRKWMDIEYGGQGGGSASDWSGGFIQVADNGFVRPITLEDELESSFVYYNIDDIGTGDDDIHNARALTGKYNCLVYMSTATGDVKSYNPEELAFNRDAIGEWINPGDLNNVEFPVRGWSDVRPAGGVKFQVATSGSVKTYKQGDEYITRFEEYNNDVINGGTWSKASLAYVSADNYNINKAVFDSQQRLANSKADQQYNEGMSTADAIRHNGLLANFNPQGDIAPILASVAESTIDAYREKKYATYFDANGNLDMAGAKTSKDARIQALYNRELEKQAELEQFTAQNIATPKFTGTPECDYDPDFNSLVVFKLAPNDKDIKKFDRILTQFGYKATDVMQKSFMSNRKNFNYIEGSGITIKCDTVPKSVRDALADAFNGGIRIWHRKPDPALYDKYNPIQTGGN